MYSNLTYNSHWVLINLYFLNNTWRLFNGMVNAIVCRYFLIYFNNIYIYVLQVYFLIKNVTVESRLFVNT